MKSVCIVGVDGTGKSTLVNNLHEWLGDHNSVIQYMGMKNWESKPAKYFFSRRKEGKLISLGMYFSVGYELYKRIYKHKNERRIIIFDRYIDEQILFLDKKKAKYKDFLKIIYRLFFALFHKPSVTIYLRCDERISLLRKNDICSKIEKESFLKSKKILDNYYCYKEGTFILDTGNISTEEVLEKVKEIIKCHVLKDDNYA